MNICRACNEDFTGSTDFDSHRVGKHAYRASPDRPDGRRCLTVEEMLERGYFRDRFGRWSHPRRTTRQKAGQSIQERLAARVGSSLPPTYALRGHRTPS